MPRANIKLPSLNNVSADSTATLSVPLGYAYNVIYLDYSGVTLAQLQNIKVQINGKTIQSFIDAVRLNDINKYYNRNVVAGTIAIWFDSTEMDTNTDRRSTSIGTQDVQTFDILVDVDAGAVAPVLKAHCIRSVNQPLGAIRKIKKWPASSAVAGLMEVDNIPKESRIAAIHLFKSDISKLEVEVSGYTWADMEKNLAASVQVQYGRNPDTAKMTTADFTLEGDPFQALIVQGANDFRLKAVLDTSGSYDIVVEYLTTFTGI